MVFGSAVLDVAAIFAPCVPDLCRLGVPSLGGRCPVACCGTSLEAHYSLDGVFKASHFVLGVPVSGGMEERRRALGGLGEADGRLRTGEPKSLHTAALAAGYGAVATIADGDCGVDVMCALLGWPRTISSRRSVRAALAESIRACAQDPHWQKAWAACQENAPPPELEEAGCETGGCASEWGSASAAQVESASVAKAASVSAAALVAIGESGGGSGVAAVVETGPAVEEGPLEMDFSGVLGTDPTANFQSCLATLSAGETKNI